MLQDLEISKKQKNFLQFHRPTIYQAVQLYEARRTMGMR